MALRSFVANTIEFQADEFLLNTLDGTLQTKILRGAASPAGVDAEGGSLYIRPEGSGSAKIYLKVGDVDTNINTGWRQLVDRIRIVSDGATSFYNYAGQDLQVLGLGGIVTSIAGGALYIDGSSLGGLTDSDDLPEGVVNLYFTDERAQDAVGGILTDSSVIDFTYNDGANTITATVKADSINDTHIDWGTGANQVSTADIPEQTNLFFTDERAQDAVGAALTDTATIDLTYNDGANTITADVKVDSINDTHIDWGTGANQVSTADIPEDTNLYFTDERAQDAVGSSLTDSSSIDLTYDDGANTITAAVKSHRRSVPLSAVDSDATATSIPGVGIAYRMDELAAPDSVSWSFLMPGDYAGGNLTISVMGLSEYLSATGNAYFTVAAVALADGDTVPAGLGAPQTITTAMSSSAGGVQKAETFTFVSIAPAGSPAAGCMMTVTFTRDTSNGADSFNGLFYLLGIRVKYDTNAGIGE